MKTNETGFEYRRLARRLFSGRLRLEPYGEELAMMRFAVALYDILNFFRSEDESRREPLLAQLQNILDRSPALAADEAEMFDYLQETILHLKHLPTEPAVERTAWQKTPVSREALSVPGMLTRDTMRYYRWLGGSLTGAGEVVEMGCWMGRSTYPLAEGLAANRSFDGRRLHALDAFTWNEWLENYAARQRDEFSPEVRARFDALSVGDNYEHLFLEFCAPHKRLIKTQTCFLYHDGESGELPPLAWDGGPVELLIQDISNGSALVQKVWDTFLPSFIPNTTVVVFHQYGHMRAEGLRRFCREKAGVLRPVHKPRGVAKAFLFTG